MTEQKEQRENTTMDAIGKLVEPVYVPWSDHRTIDRHGDAYQSRHSTGHNLWDPSSYLTGEHMAQGLTYQNSVVLVPRTVPREELSPSMVRRVPVWNIRLWQSPPDSHEGFFAFELCGPDGALMYRRGEGLALMSLLVRHITRVLRRGLSRAMGRPADVDEAKAQREAARWEVSNPTSTPGPRGFGPLY